MLHDYFRSLLSRVFVTYRIPCWVCDRPVDVPKGDPWSKAHQDPLGGAFTFEACDECRRKRGTVPERIAVVSAQCAKSDGTSLPDATSQLADMMSIIRITDAFGENGGSPVHVWSGGRYHTFREWVGTQRHQDLFEEAFVTGRIRSAS